MDLFTKKRFAVISISLLTILNLSLLGILWYTQLRKPFPHPPPEQRPQGAADFMEKELKLTAEQREKFKKIREVHLQRSNEVRFEIQRLKEQILSEAFSDSPDTSKVKRLAREIGEKETEFEEYLFQHFGELKSVCTPEQQGRLQKLFDEILNKNRLPEPPRGERNPPPPPQIP